METRHTGMPAFTLESSLITFGLMLALLIVLAILSYRDAAKRKRQMDRWPSSTQRKYDREIERKLKY